MEVNLTQEQSDVMRHAIEVGRVQDQDQAVKEAIAMWVERERRRSDLLANLDAADVSLSRGEGVVIDPETMASLARDVIDRNRHRFP